MSNRHRAIKSLYIHYPFCNSICNYCDFYTLSAKDLHRRELRTRNVDYSRYIESSYQKLKVVHEKYDLSLSSLETLYIGGGSPSIWGEEGADFVKSFLSGNQISFDDDYDYEFTLEVNPSAAATTFEVLDRWIDIGVNRFSLGVQTLDPTLYPLLGRRYKLEDAYLTMEFLQRRTSANYSVDLLLGLPRTRDGKGRRNLQRELDDILSYSPTHISAYILTPHSRYPHSLRRMLPDDEEIRNEYLFLADYLSSKGYLHYEVSNYALPGKESKHNLKYWHGASVAALGANATGYLDLSSTQGYRYKWSSYIAEAAVEGTFCEEEFLSEEEIFLERLYLQLRTNLGILPQCFFAGDELKKFWILVQSWEKKLYLSNKGPRVCLSSLGLLMLDSLMDEIFTLQVKSGE